MRPGFSAAQAIGAGLAIANLPFVNALAPRTEIADSYDFVIVGGGQAGLVIGGRLSQSLKNHSILVLEAGENGDAYRTRIDTPAYSYFDSLWTTPLNWAFYTVPQPNAADREIEWPRGKTLGGSSAINGLYLTRPGEIEINAWKDMLGDMDGAENWGWDSFFPAMKKAENFTAATSDVAKTGNIEWDASDHGTQGPIHASYPGYMFQQVGQWVQSLASAGVAISNQMYNGEPWGTGVSTSTINPTNWTRSYSRTGYLDPLPDLGNYDVLADAHVTRLIFDTSNKNNLTATGVEYTPDGGKTKKTIKVNKEVIVSAGSIGSPTVLMHSGVGPKDVLSSAGVDLLSELPGVGQHLQDHFSATVTWNTSQVTAGSIYYQNLTQKNDTLYLSYIDDGVAYVNSSGLYGGDVDSQQQSILSQMDQHTPNTTYDQGVIAGYKAIYNTTATKIFTSPIGQIEILFMNSDANGDIGITAALQHPYSHGRVYINSSNPMDYPVIDPNYFANPSDWALLRDGIKLARRVGETDPLKSTLTVETSPGTDVQSDDDLLDWIRENGGTEFHPSSSCAMLPREQGGVVDANLRVYGLANVRVADASVPPIALSTHLMASTYGIAELAADIIGKFYNPATSSSPVLSSSSTNTSKAASTTSASKNTGSTTNGTPSSLHIFTSVLFVVAVMFSSL
ncbi:glucose-methanol-choline (gmc) oxidoreductase, putative [Paecilomyces variotii No. 5]|uniref:glucose oxidase n=1 Tax=Byssochlamys spectabilis (strain No. 5 / NBRC 109023) TaxID=1356009 RepID=V5HRR2_BYSSN|nr:glucose-methanol-choline (gmc) oxidoreductase, putative [Paecilomyces variotii No. 5]